MNTFSTCTPAIRRRLIGKNFRTGQPAALNFWYRQIPRYFESAYAWRVEDTDPPHNISGMVRVTLDTLGRLVYFEAVPPQIVAPGENAPMAPDWSALFREAGFESDQVSTERFAVDSAPSLRHAGCVGTVFFQTHPTHRCGWRPQGFAEGPSISRS